MTEQTPPLDDADLGDPVPEIVALRESPTEGFLSRVRERILGRLAGTQILDFMVNGLLDFMKEVGEFLFGILDPAAPNGEGGNPGGRKSTGGPSTRRDDGTDNGGGGNRE